MLNEHKADLHIHTCLSPCADLEMTPRKIATKAKEMQLQCIGITDHNSAENVLAVRKAAERLGIFVIGGMEITSREEVHILGFFDNDEKLFEFQDIIQRKLPGENDEEIFGFQLIMDEHDNIIGKTDKLLIGATELSVEEVVRLAHMLDGVAIAAHVDRERFSIIGQLGFIPEGLALDCIEVSPMMQLHSNRPNFAGAERFPIITSSDAHSPDQIAQSYTTFMIEQANVDELLKAFRKKDGRFITAYS